MDRLANALRTLDEAVGSRPEEGHDPDLSRTIVEGRDQFFRALDDDFGTPEAFAALFEMVRGTNRAAAAGTAGGRPAARGAPRAVGAARPAGPRPDRGRGGRRRGARRGDGARPAAAAGARGARLRARRRAPGPHPRPRLGGHRHRRGPAGRAGMSRYARGSAPDDGREAVYGRNPVRELLAAGRRGGPRGPGPARAGGGALAGRRRGARGDARPPGAACRHRRPPGRRGPRRPVPVRGAARPAGAPRPPGRAWTARKTRATSARSRGRPRRSGPPGSRSPAGGARE